MREKLEEETEKQDFWTEILYRLIYFIYFSSFFEKKSE